MTGATHRASVLLPRTTPGPGQALWGEAPRRQPIAPLVLMAVLLLLVAAPTALAGDGGSGNPLTLLRQIASSTYELTGLVQRSNESLAKIDTNSKALVRIEQNMTGISAATDGMAQKTTKLNDDLGGVQADVGAAKTTLHSVSGKLGTTGTGMSQIATGVDGSLASTKQIVGEFRTISGAITVMQQNLVNIIARMGRSLPLTKDFANNETRKAIAGGDGKKFGVPNFAADNRVMSIMLPMIKTLQAGGPIAARKDTHRASNPIVDTALKLQVPDGTNVEVNVRPYDGFYGLPPASFFIERQVHGL